MGIVVDTNFFIDVEQRRKQFAQLVEVVGDDAVYIAAVTASELLTGVHMATELGQKLNRQAFVEFILKGIPVLPFDEAAARNYAELYAHFLKLGQRSKLNVHDLQIAATALTHGFSVITANHGDFAAVPGIKLLDISTDL